MTGLRYISLHVQSGYGIAARRYMLGLMRLGVPLTWTPMVLGRGWGLGYEPYRGDGVGDPDLDSVCNKPVPYDVVVMHLPPEYYPLCAQRESAKKMVGHTVWETDKLPRHWPALLNSVDLVLVPTGWNREVFRQSGVETPISVVPHCLDPNLRVPRDLNPAEDPPEFVFYTINVWTARKTVWNTLHAFLRAFTEDDPVVLVVKTSERDMSRARLPFTYRFLFGSRRAVDRIRGRYRRPAKIRLITDLLSADEILALHHRGDCYVSLCRSEGWGMGAFDAAAYANPVIMTGYGGQREFLPEQLAYLVDYRLTPVRDSVHRRSYSPDQNWAAPDLDHASRLMRQVFEDRQEARRRGSALSRRLRASFDAEVVARKFLNAVS